MHQLLRGRSCCSFDPRELKVFCVYPTLSVDMLRKRTHFNCYAVFICFQICSRCTRTQRSEREKCRPRGNESGPAEPATIRFLFPLTKRQNSFSRAHVPTIVCSPRLGRGTYILHGVRIKSLASALTLFCFSRKIFSSKLSFTNETHAR